ncbi:hypothetical protein J6338_14015, partial [Staphylococcus aureus]
MLTTGRLVRHGRPAQPVMINAATLRKNRAAPREARLVPERSVILGGRVSRRIDIAEGVEDGDARPYTYQHVVLDVKGSKHAAIDDGLHGRISSLKAHSEPPEEELKRGIPINVSLARPAVGAGAKVHEIIVAPQSRERLGALLQAAG